MGQLVGCHPAKWKVTGSIPGQGTCPGCRFGPHSAHKRETTYECFSLTSMFLFPSLSSFLSLSLKIKKFCGTPKHTLFANLTKKIKGIILIHSHQKAIVLGVVIFKFDNPRQKGSMPLSKLSVIACFINSRGTLVENCCTILLTF